MARSSFVLLLDLLQKLDEAHIPYRLSSVRARAVMVEVAVPGERWEIEFLEDGSCEVERFKSDGNIMDENALVELFKRFSD